MTPNDYLWSRSTVTRQVTNTRFEGDMALGLGLEPTESGSGAIETYVGFGLYTAF